MDLERFQHRYIIGKTGTGKSTTLLRFMLEDIERGEGLLYIDPHGDDAEKLLDLIPRSRKTDVILFDPSRYTSPINILENVAVDQRPRIASSVVEIIRNVARYEGAPTPVLNRVVRHAVMALFDMPNATLLNIRDLLLNERFRTRAIDRTTDPITRSFWQDEFLSMTEREQRDFRASTLNNLDALIDDARLRHTIGYPRSVFNMVDVLNGKILIARLPQGALGIEKTRVLGAILLAMLHSVALGRANHLPFHVYLDECHHFGTGTLIEMLSGIRKFGVSLTLCHQYLRQLSPELQNAIIGNVGTKIVFRVGISDAEFLEHEFGVNNVLSNLVDLHPGVARIATPSDSLVQRFMPTIPQRTSISAEIEKYSRRHYARSERAVSGWIAHNP